MKTVEHGKGFSVCRHKGEHWGTALAGAYQCLGVTASIPEETAIVWSLMRGEAVWHRGHLLNAGRAS